ncbi:conserved oligomeric Golgi complex subunit 4 [Prunus yedoensis var. nudiflora]|uniref:Conserved oligomeric Golgi complex subunit 4 n=1 Tax=Prunus yedoensis var. nudiflora TaxID=2094558 RepID=A0A314V096_PRUYE|nr:conserved oligomeric Golgi complex subunit 4 [Prunus yedoensis var. nudiflora]
MEPADQPSIKFGTQEALSHVRALTDVGAMTRLLHECIAYQRSLDLELDSLLSQRTDLDKQLLSLHSSSQVLHIVKADSDHVLANVTSTCDLADQVSAKVRELDLAQSRVKSTLLRLDAIVERGNCIDGVKQALDAQDYESAAKYVQRFIQIDSEYKDSGGSEQREQLMESKRQLESIVRRKLSEAVDQREHPTVLRFIRLYTPLGLETEGLQVYVGYLRKDIVLAVEENDEILRGLCGEDGVVYAICELQEECDTRGSLILKKYMEYRRLPKLSSEINTQNKNLLDVGGVGSEGPDPREVELFLEEILSLMQLGEDYTEFMVSKIKGLTNVDPDLGPRATKAFRSGSFSKSHDFVVDDVFYVLQSCLRRAISTLNISSVIAVLSVASSLLSNEYHEALQQKMREPNLGAKLFLGGVGVQKTGTEIATVLNNMDVSSEYVLKLKHEIEEQCLEVFPAPVDREKVKSCLSELGDMSNTFKQALNAGLEQLVATVAPRLRPVLDYVGTISYELSEAQYATMRLMTHGSKGCFMLSRRM